MYEVSHYGDRVTNRDFHHYEMQSSSAHKNYVVHILIRNNSIRNGVFSLHPLKWPRNNDSNNNNMLR